MRAMYCRVLSVDSSSRNRSERACQIQRLRTKSSLAGGNTISPLLNNSLSSRLTRARRWSAANLHYRGWSADNPQVGVIGPAVTKGVHRFVKHEQDARMD